MEVKDAFAAWEFRFNDENVLSVYFFSHIAFQWRESTHGFQGTGSNPFHVMMGKEPPADLQWYPHIELEITFKPDEPRNLANIKEVSLAINKIEDTGSYGIPLFSNYGGNNPRSVDGHEKLETVFGVDGKLDMVFKGETIVRTSKFTWDVELKDQPVVGSEQSFSSGSRRLLRNGPAAGDTVSTNTESGEDNGRFSSDRCGVCRSAISIVRSASPKWWKLAAVPALIAATQHLFHGGYMGDLFAKAWMGFACGYLVFVSVSVGVVKLIRVSLENRRTE